MGIENNNTNQNKSFDMTNISAWKVLHTEARKLFKDNPNDIDGNIAILAQKYELDPEILKKKIEKKGYYRNDEPLFGKPDKPVEDINSELSPEKYDLGNDDEDGTYIEDVLGSGSGQSQPAKRPLRLYKKDDNAPDEWALVSALYKIPVDWDSVRIKNGGGSYVIKEMLSNGDWRIIRDHNGHPMLPVTIAKALNEGLPANNTPAQSTKESLDIMGAMTSVLKNTMDITLNSAKPNQELEKFKLDIMDKSHARELELQKEIANSHERFNQEVMKRYDERLSELSKQKSGGLLGNLKEIATIKTELSPVLQMLGFTAVETIKREDEGSKFWTFAKNLTNNPLFAEKIGEGINGLLGGIGLLLAGFAAKAQGNNAPAESPKPETKPVEQKQLEQPKQPETKEVAKKDDLIVQGYHLMIKKLNILFDSKRLTYDQYLWFMEGMEVPLYYPQQIAKLDELIVQIGIAVKAGNKAQFEQIERQIRGVFLTDFDFSPSLKIKKQDKDGKDYEEVNPNVEIFLNRFIQYSLPESDGELDENESKT